MYKFLFALLLFSYIVRGLWSCLTGPLCQCWIQICSYLRSMSHLSYKCCYKRWICLPRWLSGLNHWPWCMLAGLEFWVVGSNSDPSEEVYWLCSVHAAGWKLMLPSFIGGTGRLAWPADDNWPLWACRSGPACLAHAVWFGVEKWPWYRLGALVSISTKPLRLTTHTHTRTHYNNNNTHRDAHWAYDWLQRCGIIAHPAVKWSECWLQKQKQFISRQQVMWILCNVCDHSTYAIDVWPADHTSLILIQIVLYLYEKYQFLQENVAVWKLAVYLICSLIEWSVVME